MPEIRYWNMPRSNAEVNKIPSLQNAEKTNQTNNFKAFQATMLNTLLDSSDKGSGFNADFGSVFSSGQGSGLNLGLSSGLGSSFGANFSAGLNSNFSALFDLNDGLKSSANNDALEKKLRDIKNQGMEKVWAAQLSNPLPNFGAFGNNSVGGNNGNRNTNNNSSIGGFNEMIALTIQEQIIKTKRALQDQATSFQNTPLLNDSINNAPVNIADFIDTLQDQIQSAAEKYSVDQDYIKQQILLDPLKS